MIQVDSLTVWNMSNSRMGAKSGISANFGPPTSYNNTQQQTKQRGTTRLQLQANKLAGRRHN